MKNTSIYRGFEIRQEGNNIDIRRHYPASVHKGFPQEWTPAVRDAASPEQANKQLEDFLARYPKI
jgi:hypothetical protein